MRGHVEFDDFADDYDSALQTGLRLSGETKTYFAKGRIEWLARGLKHHRLSAKRALDFGCGTGTSVPLLLDVLGLDSVVGTDLSSHSIDIASKRFGSDRATFVTFENFQPESQFDLAFCNGVFHHIPPADRPMAIDCVYRSLKPGGLWAFWENNPWNPGTRWVMHRIPFDRDAIMLSSRQADRMLRAQGFEVLSVDYQFIFPAMLSWLRPIEPYLARWPIGAQYQLLCRRPMS